VQHLFAGYWILIDIRNESKKACPGPEWSPETLRELNQKLKQEAELNAEYGLRVGVRTPAGAPVSEAQGEANQIFLDYKGEYGKYVATRPIEQEKPPPPPHGEAFRSIQAFINQIRLYVDVAQPTRARSSRYQRFLSGFWAGRRQA
jgi:hypothetical protein